MHVTNNSIGWIGWDRIYSALEIEEVYLLSHPPATSLSLSHSSSLSLYLYLSLRLPLSHSLPPSASLSL